MSQASARVFLTILSQNYVPQARCLFESLREHHPEARRVLCLVENTIPGDLFRHDDFEVMLAGDCVGEAFDDMAFRYSLVELNTAVKPFVMRHLMVEGGAEVVTYIDPDCFVFAPLDEVFETFGQGANIVLTPHATAPIEDGQAPGEIDFLRAGTFNLGFIAARKSPETLKALSWWADRLEISCHFDAVAGLFVDQKWMDLAPCFFSGVQALRHPGYNVAYWNAFQRRIDRRPGGWFVDGEPLRFFHFSSLPQDDADRIARHQNRLTAETIGPFISEFHSYLGRLAAHALKPAEEQTYSYALRWKGDLVECQALRSALRRLGAPAQPSAGERSNHEEAIEALLAPHPALPLEDMFPISRLLYDAWSHAPLLAEQYPLFTAEGRAKFLLHVLLDGHRALEINVNLLPWKALNTPVAGALGGRLALPPIFWLLWMQDKALRRRHHFDGEAGLAGMLIRLVREVQTGARPAALLPSGYLTSTVVGHGDSSISVAEYVVWVTREDLRSEFDLDTLPGRVRFKDWCQGASIDAEIPWMRTYIPLSARAAAA